MQNGPFVMGSHSVARSERMQALEEVDLGGAVSILETACDLLSLSPSAAGQITVVLPLVTGQAYERSSLRLKAANLAEQCGLDARFEHGPTSVTVRLSDRR
jgi:hypothetical protein